MTQAVFSLLFQAIFIINMCIMVVPRGLNQDQGYIEEQERVAFSMAVKKGGIGLPSEKLTYPLTK